VISAADGWAVGNRVLGPTVTGLLLRWDGSQWLVFSDTVSSTLNAITMVTPSDGWAVGNSGLILHWNGITWAPVSSPTAANLTAVEIVSPNDGWALGSGGVLLRWNGSTWQSFTNPTPVSLGAIDMLSSSDGWGISAAKIYHWDGNAWTEASGPITAGTLSDIAMASATQGWAVGYDLTSGSIILRWDGQTWSRVSGPATRLQRLGIVSPREAWAVGTSGTTGTIAHFIADCASGCAITGQVRDGSDNPLVGVTVSAGAAGSTITDASGSYTITNILTGTYTLTPTLSGYAFSPVTRTADVPPDATGQNFTATVPPTYTVAGRVADISSNPLTDVLVTMDAYTATTNASGYYTFTNVLSGTYLLTPTLSGYTFTPFTRTVSVPSSTTGLDFSGARRVFLPIIQR
jgi:hypothetical protein